MNSNLICFGSLAMLLFILSGCGSIPYKASTNSKISEGEKSTSQASFELRNTRIKKIGDERLEVDCNPKKHKKNLVLLALSGGGSRAALLSGLSMDEMKNIQANGSSYDILSEVDLISSVSGGSLAAAYYAISGEPEAKNECDTAVSGREWSKENVIELMSKNYILPWIGNWFWPDNIFHYWLSTYDRTDIMAQTFADNLFDRKSNGLDLKFSELNPARPNLIINATKGSSNFTQEQLNESSFGQAFTFSAEDFGKICSSIDEYDLSRGVMASATFPGVFNFMTLENHCLGNQNQYVHVFDGGNADNLGLTSIKRAIWSLHRNKQLKDYEKITVILVDAYVNSSGVDEKHNDPRPWYGFIVDLNFIVATDSLLGKNRERLLTEFETKNIFPYNRMENQGMVDSNKRKITACNSFFNWKGTVDAAKYCNDSKFWEDLNKDIHQKMQFVHITFDETPNPDLQRQLNNIATNFRLNDDRDDKTHLTDKEAIICAVPALFGRDSKCPYNEEIYNASENLKEKWSNVVKDFNSSTNKRSH